MHCYIGVQVNFINRFAHNIIPENTSCSPFIMIVGDIIMFLLSHHSFVVKSMGLITYQHFGECICVVSLCFNIAEFYHIIIHMFYLQNGKSMTHFSN